MRKCSKINAVKFNPESKQYSLIFLKDIFIYVYIYTGSGSNEKTGAKRCALSL